MIKRLSDGDITMTVTNAELAEGKYGTQVMFVGQEEGEPEDTVLYISERSAVRQLERLSLTVEGCAGETLLFSQVKKDDRTYNNIYRAEGGAQPKAQAKPMATQAPKVTAEFNSAYDLYAECLSNAAKMVLAMSEETGVAVGGSDIVAAAATLFIQQCRR